MDVTDTTRAGWRGAGRPDTKLEEGIMVMAMPKTWKDLPLLLTTDEAAELFRVHVNTIKYWIRTDKLPATKIGKGWRIKREDVLELLDVDLEAGDD